MIINLQKCSYKTPPYHPPPEKRTLLVVLAPSRKRIPQKLLPRQQHCSVSENPFNIGEWFLHNLVQNRQDITYN